MLARLFNSFIGVDFINDILFSYGIISDTPISSLTVEALLELVMSVSAVIFCFMLILSIFIYLILMLFKSLVDFGFSSLGFVKSICFWLFRKVFGEKYLYEMLVDYLKKQ